ncbi:MAG: putative metal-dependent hydrolase [Bacteroidetes bacterium]|nr:putative metal-dependent hydrolase [Bacteroidota bacterium]
MTEDLRYPIGKYIEQPFSEEILQEWLLDIETLPRQIEYAVVNLDEAQLDTPYREGGWTVKQLVHHVADSHMNAYIRFKLGLTEDNPMVKAYDENEWAKMADTEIVPINVSITLLYALHRRWSTVLSSIQGDQWNRKVYHSEHKREMTLWFLLGMYAWHSRHHTAHITRLRDRMNWW